MRRRLKIGLIAVSAVLLALIAALLRPSKPGLSIRIAGVATNFSSSRTAIEWSVAVPQSKSHQDAVSFWSLHIEPTNKADVSYSAIALSSTENALLIAPGIAAHEDGILTSSEGEILDPEKAYRIMGAYREPNRMESLLIRWSLRVPVIGRLLPKPAMATSEWFVVTAAAKPAETRNE